MDTHLDTILSYIRGPDRNLKALLHALQSLQEKEINPVKLKAILSEAKATISLSQWARDLILAKVIPAPE